MLKNIIPSLAILKVNWDTHQGDYIDNFVPFVAESLRVTEQQIISVSELQSSVLELFGMDIPQGALNTILKRAVKKGYAEKKERVYYKNDLKLSTLNFASIRTDVMREYEALIDKLLAFCKEKHNIIWTPEQAEAGITNFIQEKSPSILASAIDGVPFIVQEKNPKNKDYIIGAFIVELEKKDPVGFQFLETIVKGIMLASVLRFHDVGSVKRRFGTLTVYFDTGFLLRALGFAGEIRKIPCLELINLLHAFKINLRVFDITFDEIYNVLDAAARSLRSNTSYKYSYFEILEYFFEANYHSSDVELLLARLEQELRRIYIFKEERPSHEKILTLDEGEMEVLLHNEVGHRNRDALLHDLDALSAIYRLRRGRRFRTIEDCEAIFVTTNSLLVKASNKFFNKVISESNNSEFFAPICIADHVLTTIAWLKSPTKAQKLGSKVIIAEAYAALKPPDNLWRLYLEEIDRLNKAGNLTVEDYYLLRSSTAARNALMDITLGETEAFTEGSISEILNSAKRARDAIIENAITDEREKRIKAEEKAERAEFILTAERQNRNQRLEELGRTIGKGTGKGIFFGGILLLIIATYKTLPFPLPGFKENWWRFITPTLIAILAILSICNIIWGSTLRVIIDRLEVKISKLAEYLLHKILGNDG